MSGGHHYGDVVTFQCSSGFVPVGSSERTCQADQTWSGTDFSCHRPCQREYILFEAEGTCLKFADDRETYQGSRDSCREYGNGGKLVVIKTPAMDEFIETNLRNMGRNDSDGETWIGLDNLTDQGNFVWSDGSVLSTQDYQNWGIGQPDIDAERCVEIWPQSGYKWNNIPCHDSNYYICQKAVKCARPTAPENGAMTPSGSQQDPVKFFYQDTAEFSCNAGYGLTGQTSISCREDGSWSSGVPTCTAVPCPQPTVPVNGEMTSGSDPDHDMVNFTFQDTVSFTCDLGYDLVGAESVTCQADSTWSDSFPTCTPVQCPMPETPANGAMTGLNFYQDVLEFTCESGYDLIGEAWATCHADRTWSARAPTCTDINECVVSPWICGRNSACVNLDGSFDCKCLAGYEMGPGGCQDIDECSSKVTCSEDTFCVNDPGTYHCVCREGFTGDGVTCTEIVTTSTPASLTTVQSTTMTAVTPTTGKYTSPPTPTPTTTTTTDSIQRSTSPNTPFKTTTATTQPGDAMEPDGKTTEPFPTSTVTLISHEPPKSSSLPVSEATTADLQLDDPGKLLEQLFPSGDSPSDDGKVDSTTCTEAMKTLAKLSRTPSAKDSTDKMVTIFNTVVTMCGTLPLDAQAEGGYVVGAMTDSIMQSVLEGASMKELAPKASAVVDTVASLMESGGSETVVDDEDDVIALSRLPPRKRDEFQKQMEKKRQQKQKQQWALQREVTQRLQKDLDNMADALLGSVDSGERVELGSKAVQMVLDKSSGGRLGGAAVAAHAGRVTFPHAHALYNGGIIGDVEMKVENAVTWCGVST
ncbi:PREDICTED: E-selectin-like [Branchiostoma belcheri]|uniref:E-selectin-like n=1 Tax=Branchiostoma belcheri TaxID=7741 RepID=A0A6P4ZA71_BRABE|nr:PREDICTED: E-selectin-like [Branchiostoma belcheri]